MRKIFISEKRGASLTGYGLVVGLIGIIAIVAVQNVGESISVLFTNVGNKMDDVASGASSSSGGGGGGSTANSAPSAPIISSASFVENNAVNDVIGTVSATDVDVGQNLTYSLSGTDAAFFTLAGIGADELQAAQIFDFESFEDADGDNVFEIIITATDDGSPVEASNANLSITLTNDEAEIGPSGQIVCPSILVESQPPFGDIGCDDGFGNFYVGTSNASPMYAASADEATGLAWNDGSGFQDGTDLSDIAFSDGAANTELLAAGDDGFHYDSSSAGGLLIGLNSTGTPGNSLHLAAEACATKATTEFSDWYMPALDELALVYDNLVDQDGNNAANPTASSIFGFVTTGASITGEYWSSSEALQDGRRIRFSDGVPNPNNKNGTRVVRCVRR